MKHYEIRIRFGVEEDILDELKGEAEYMLGEFILSRAEMGQAEVYFPTFAAEMVYDEAEGK